MAIPLSRRSRVLALILLIWWMPIRRSIRSFETLAMAYAEVGRCEDAFDWQSQAWEASLDFDDQTLAEDSAAPVEVVLANDRGP